MHIVDVEPLGAEPWVTGLDGAASPAAEELPWGDEEAGGDGWAVFDGRVEDPRGQTVATDPGMASARRHSGDSSPSEGTSDAGSAAGAVVPDPERDEPGVASAVRAIANGRCPPAATRGERMAAALDAMIADVRAFEARGAEDDERAAELAAEASRAIRRAEAASALRQANIALGATNASPTRQQGRQDEALRPDLAAPERSLPAWQGEADQAAELLGRLHDLTSGPAAGAMGATMDPGHARASLGGRPGAARSARSPAPARHVSASATPDPRASVRARGSGRPPGHGRARLAATGSARRRLPGSAQASLGPDSSDASRLSSRVPSAAQSVAAPEASHDHIPTVSLRGLGLRF